jgi:alpha-beta hydrolase superfamily lysophospholipase
MDFNIKLRSGKVLSGIIQSAGEETKAVIIFVHGLGEHIRRYSLWADLFRKEGIGFAGVDLPGHGRSDGKRGHIGPYSLTSEMLDILMRSCNKTFTGVPVYIYGHSLGGLIVLDYLLNKAPAVKGAIITSPWLRLGFEPSNSKVQLASMVRFVLPSLVQPSGLIHEHLSHDEKVISAYRNDPLVHDRISVSLFHGAMNSAKYCLEHASELKVPTLLIHGSDDPICSPDGSREFASKTNKVKLKIWDAGYHELHNEPFKEEVFKYIVDWIKK